ncbi:MAG: carotenoid 1,2-hydratase [Pseudomonadota bacterium]
MTERGRSALAQTPDSFTVGPSSIRWQNDTLVIAVNEICAPLPRRLSGEIRFRPDFVQNRSFELDSNARHHWWPYAPFGTISADFQRPALSWSGHGYADTNTGSAALEDDFSGWTWSRATVDDGTVIFYEPDERSGRQSVIAIHVDHQGRVETYTAPPTAQLKPGLWGIKRHTRSEIADEAKITTPFLDAPFYTRDVISIILNGKACPAVHEALNLDRFRSGWVKRLLPFRMPRRSHWPT